MKHRTTESGNVLFLILIAVALFAALSYAVTRSTSGGGTVDKEQRRIIASEIIQYATEVEQAFKRILLIGGYDYIYAEFKNPNGAGGTDNPNCVESTCNIFTPSELGVP